MLITIITPCLNRRETIAAAVESVMAQDWNEIEHIVVDGGSTDGTLELLSRYRHLRVISEPDRGLYDAINKGLRLARGDIVGHLNSDDLYAPNVFGSVAGVFAAEPEIASVCGGVEIFVDAGQERRAIQVINNGSIKQLRRGDIIHGVPITNARFFRRSLYDQIGLYDIRYRLAADRDFLMRMVLAGVMRGTVAGIVYMYRSHPGSLTLHGRASNELLREYQAIAVDRWREHGSTDSSPGARATYRQWHAWASAALLRDDLNGRRFGDALRCAVAASGRDAAWPLRVLRQILEHKRGAD